MKIIVILVKTNLTIIYILAIAFMLPFVILEIIQNPIQWYKKNKLSIAV